MTDNTTAGAAVPASGAALPTLLRVVGEQFERIDFQKTTIDGLRDDLREALRQRDDGNDTIRAYAETEVALRRDIASRETHLRSCEKALEEAQAERDRFRDVLEKIRVEADSGRVGFRDFIKHQAGDALGVEWADLNPPEVEERRVVA